MLADRGRADGHGAGTAVTAGAGAMTPVPYRVVGRRDETDDVTTLSLSHRSPAAAMAFRPGQFNMLTAFGVGEAAISVSSAPHDDGPLRHTVRDVGTGDPCPVPGARSATSSASGAPSAPTGGSGPTAGDPGEARSSATEAMSSSWPEASASPRCAARSTSWWPGADADGGRVFVLVGARDPRRSSSATTSRRGRAPAPRWR